MFSKFKKNTGTCYILKRAKEQKNNNKHGHLLFLFFFVHACTFIGKIGLVLQQL